MKFQLFTMNFWKIAAFQREFTRNSRCFWGFFHTLEICKALISLNSCRFYYFFDFKREIMRLNHKNPKWLWRISWYLTIFRFSRCLYICTEQYAISLCNKRWDNKNTGLHYNENLLHPFTNFWRYRIIFLKIIHFINTNPFFVVKLFIKP